MKIAALCCYGKNYYTGCITYSVGPLMTFTAVVRAFFQFLFAGKKMSKDV